MILPTPRLPGGARLADYAVGVGLFAVALLSLATNSGAPGEFRPSDAWGIVLIAGQTLPLIWRQLLPRAMFLVVLGSWIINVGLTYQTSFAGIGVVIAMHAIGAFVPRRKASIFAAGALVVALGWTAVGAVVSDKVGAVELVIVALAVVIPFAMGVADAARRQRVTDLVLEHQHAVRIQHESADVAVRTERARIARELHDVVAHEITVMTLQAEGARRMAAGTNPAVVDALATISESGRKGLVEMQRMIGVLRDTSETDSEEPRVGSPHLASGGHDLAPVPSLSALAPLVAQVTDAGLPATLKITGGAHVPAGVELSAYRIVQESLTNALKHAGPGAKATVAVVRKRDAVTITVEDDGRGVIEESMVMAGGHGLAGMRERVQALGGVIEIGPRKGGGYRVHATLPSHDDQVNQSRAPHRTDPAS